MKSDESDSRAPEGGTFTRLATVVARATASPAAFILAVLVVLTWALTGPLFGYSDTWQLVINTGTTVVTFMMALSTRRRCSSNSTS